MRHNFFFEGKIIVKIEWPNKLLCYAYDLYKINEQSIIQIQKSIKLNIQAAKFLISGAILIFFHFFYKVAEEVNLS